MPRHQEHNGGAYTKIVAVKMNDEAIGQLDRLRGETPRSTYFRELLRAEVNRNKDPKPTGRRFIVQPMER
jgi:geranylgeranyl pyrophosphate synthase